MLTDGRVPPSPSSSSSAAATAGGGAAKDDEILSQIMQNFRPVDSSTMAATVSNVPTPPSPEVRHSHACDVCMSWTQQLIALQFSSANEVYSTPKRLLRQEVGGGVQVEYYWRHHGRCNPAKPTRMSAVFTLTNKRDHPAKR